MAITTLKGKITNALALFWNCMSQIVVKYDDVVDNCNSLADASTTKPLSAYQGYSLQRQIDDISLNNVKAVNFSFTLTDKTTGGKSGTVTIPNGYELLCTHPVGSYISGYSSVYVCDKNLSQSGTTVTVSYYLYNPSSYSGTLVYTGAILLKKKFSGTYDGEEAVIENGIETYIRTVGSMMYPVGSIYMSVNSTNPSILFGGTWERLQDRFLLAAGSSYSAGTTGGEATHTLQISEIPSHGHTLLQAGGSGAQITPNAGSGAGSVTIKAYDAGSGWIPSGSQYIGTNSWPAQTQSVGGGGAHNNMPPYLSVYMWKRTA